ncbi:hypothetical protein BDN70DRAFT_938745 [Pholiota conissans]|uniref:Uncharacterized protein n=1 Tax=Pholiota conissans TaxID=109636 RepID=A0A9P5YM64_9AGAR|nr:hypothetical protein BDN70DRAFT_938745 [Pholiota conissans]
MGKRWTNLEQQAWLIERIPGFLNVRNTSRIRRFHTTTQEMWFQKFSEQEFCFGKKPDEELLTEEEQDVLAQAIIKRKKQLQDWFKNNGKLYNATIKAVREDSKILKALNVEAAKFKSERAPHRVEAYLKVPMGRAKVDADYALEVLRLETSTGIKLPQGALLNLKLNIARDLLKEETPEVHKLVDAEITDWRAQHADVKLTVELPDTEYVPKTPAEYQSSIDALPAFFKLTFTALAAASGWSFVVMAGGPVPKEGGKVFVENHYFGPKSLAGNNFQQAHLDFERDVERPFCDHTLNCFPNDVCSSRALVGMRGVDALKTMTSGVDAALVMSTLGRDDPDSADDEDLLDEGVLDSLTTLELGDRQPINRITPPISVAAPRRASTPAAVPPQLRDNAFGSHEPPPFPFPSYEAPEAPGGPTEHISHAFSHMSDQMAPPGIRPVNQEAPRPIVIPRPESAPGPLAIPRPESATVQPIVHQSPVIDPVLETGPTINAISGPSRVDASTAGGADKLVPERRARKRKIDEAKAEIRRSKRTDRRPPPRADAD